MTAATYPGLPAGVGAEPGRIETGAAAVHVHIAAPRSPGAPPFGVSLVLLPHQARALALLLWDRAAEADGSVGATDGRP